MGLVYAEISLRNGLDVALYNVGKLKKRDIRELKVKSLVNSGAYMLAINENAKNQLGLVKVDEKVAELADGTRHKLDVVGPVEIHFKNRRANVDAMVLPADSTILLGSIPMEDMDVIIDPKKQELIVNPETPYIPKTYLK